MLLLNMLSLIGDGERPVCRPDHSPGGCISRNREEVRQPGPVVEAWRKEGWSKGNLCVRGGD